MGTIYLRYCWPRWRPISRFTLCHQRMRFCAGTLLSLLRPNGEMHIGLYSEAARQVPDALHGRVADADLLGQHPCAPVCCVLGLLLGRPRHDREPHFGTDRLLARAWPLAPILEKSLDAAVHVGFLPAPNRRLRYPSLALDSIGADPATRQQHNARAHNDLLRRLAIGDEPLQCRPVTGPDVAACFGVSHA